MATTVLTIVASALAAIQIEFYGVDIDACRSTALMAGASCGNREISPLARGLKPGQCVLVAAKADFFALHCVAMRGWPAPLVPVVRETK